MERSRREASGTTTAEMLLAGRLLCCIIDSIVLGALELVQSLHAALFRAKLLLNLGATVLYVARAREALWTLT